MMLGICKKCGGSFWESSRGARGEDLCDKCLDETGHVNWEKLSTEARNDGHSSAIDLAEGVAILETERTVGPEFSRSSLKALQGFLREADQSDPTVIYFKEKGLVW